MHLQNMVMNTLRSQQCSVSLLTMSFQHDAWVKLLNALFLYNFGTFQIPPVGQSDGLVLTYRLFV